MELWILIWFTFNPGVFIAGCERAHEQPCLIHTYRDAATFKDAPSALEKYKSLSDKTKVRIFKGVEYDPSFTVKGSSAVPVMATMTEAEFRALLDAAARTAEQKVEQKLRGACGHWTKRWKQPCGLERDHSGSHQMHESVKGHDCWVKWGDNGE